MHILHISKTRKVKERYISIEIPHIGLYLDATKTAFTRQDLALKWAKKRLRKHDLTGHKLIINKEESRYVVRVMRTDTIQSHKLRQTGRAPFDAIASTIGQYTRGV